MATPYSDIFSKFMDKVTDYGFYNLTSEQLETILLGYLKGAIIKFTQCRSNLADRNDVQKQFSEDLTELEQEILAYLMLQEWLRQKINHSNYVEISLGTKDFKLYSPANHLKELRNLKKEIKSDTNELIRKYTYGNIIDDLK